MSKRNISFLIIFTFIGLVAFRLPIANIIGSSQSFTVFDYLGPTAGLFLGPLFGALSVFFVRFFHLLFSGEGFEWLAVLRFLPMMLAAVYLGSKSKRNLFIPLLCLFLFIAHPEGRMAWPYALYWLIPVLAVFKKERLIFNALGATFTAHAVGSVIFLYAFNLPAAVWISLIPIVAVERGFFALGIWVSYPAFNTLISKASVKFNLPVLEKLVNRQYIYSKKFLKHRA